MVAAERLHGCVVDHTHRQSECFGKIETNPTFAQMLRISCNPSVAHRHGKTNGCPVEFPTAHVLFKSCHKLFWPHSLPGRKFALIARRHQQFYVCAADIDDQNLSLHERAAAPNASGKITGCAAWIGQDVGKNSVVLVLSQRWHASIPLFRERETGTAVAPQISNRAADSWQFVALTGRH